MARSFGATAFLTTALVLALSVPAFAKGGTPAPAQKKKAKPPQEIYLGLSGVT